MSKPRYCYLRNELRRVYFFRCCGEETPLDADPGDEPCASCADAYTTNTRPEFVGLPDFRLSTGQ